MKTKLLGIFVPLLLLACDFSGGTTTYIMSLSDPLFDGVWKYSSQESNESISSIITIDGTISEFIRTSYTYNPDTEYINIWSIKSKGQVSVSENTVTISKNFMYEEGFWLPADQYFIIGVEAAVASGSYTQTEAEEIYTEYIAPITLTLSSDGTTLTTEDADGIVLEYIKQ